jgi:deferrochelatase/peroxidase EfeB
LPEFHTADSNNPRSAKLINDFIYRGDICPASAHIRKTNPRITNADPNQNSERLPRAAIIRNGIPYGSEYTGKPEDTSTRGLLFACYQGHIEDGFEQLQVDWSNSDQFPRARTGIDPIIGQVEQSPKGVNGTLTTTITTLTTEGKASHQEGNMKTVSFQQLVTFRGGGYFFVPSISALQHTLGQD